MLTELMESIKEFGVVTPIITRPKEVMISENKKGSRLSVKIIAT